MPQLPLFPDSLPRPRLPKAVVAQSRSVRSRIEHYRRSKQRRWLLYMAGLESVKFADPPSLRGAASLTEQDVRDIRASKLTKTQLAAKYQRGWTTIHDVVRGKTFKDVT